MRSTICFLATFTAYVGSCTSDRPEFGQPVNNSFADAADGSEGTDAGTPSGTDLSSSASSAGVDGSNTTTSASDASSRDEGGASTAETSSSKSTGVDTGGDAPQTTTTDDNGANGDGADGGADGGASAGVHLANGESCVRSSNCASGFCADGVCCDGSCDGVCAACDQPGSKGTCTPTESDEACGTLSCPAESECLSYEGMSLDANCAALDRCVEEAACTATAVAASTPCQDGAGMCDGHGECVVPDKRTLGETCDTSEECGSGHCTESVDGRLVCCDTACDGVCQSCGASGRCDATPKDDAACDAIECAEETACSSYPGRLESNRCASFGQCVTAAAYCSPEHADEGKSCGTSRACDGAGECQLVCPTDRGADRTCTAECPCDAGGGGCTNNAQCQAGLVCATGGGAKYGLAGNTCLPAHCDNDMQDDSETSIDCGGECGCAATLEVEDYLFATGVSDDGNIVVGMDNGAHVSRAGMSREFLGDYWVSGVSGDGKVIFGTGDGGPVRWVNGGPPELLVSDLYSGGSPLSASRTGSTIVGLGRTADSVEEGFIWTDGTTSRISGFHSFGSISTDGTLVLGFQPGEEGQRGTPALWSAASGTTPLVLQGSWATMSRNGEYVLLQVTSGSPSPYVLLRNNESVIPLTPFDEGDDYVNGVSNDGIAVGQSSGNALYWSSETGYEPRLIDDLMRERGLEPDGVALVNASLITPDGKTIIAENTAGLWRLRLH